MGRRREGWRTCLTAAAGWRGFPDGRAILACFAQQPAPTISWLLRSSYTALPKRSPAWVPFWEASPFSCSPVGLEPTTRTCARLFWHGLRGLETSRQNTFLLKKRRLFFVTAIGLLRLRALRLRVKPPFSIPQKEPFGALLLPSPTLYQKLHVTTARAGLLRYAQFNSGGRVMSQENRT